MNTLVSRFINDESGVTAIEYATITALITTVIIATAPLLATNLSAVFTSIGIALTP
jgi:pilus assembly protein Flp/PilA